MLTRLGIRADYGEDRWIGIGFLQTLVVVLVYTENEDVIRIISLRKALKHEQRRFEQVLENELGQS